MSPKLTLNSDSFTINYATTWAYNEAFIPGKTSVMSKIAAQHQFVHNSHALPHVYYIEKGKSIRIKL